MPIIGMHSALSAPFVRIRNRKRCVQREPATGYWNTSKRKTQTQAMNEKKKAESALQGREDEQWDSTLD